MTEPTLDQIRSQLRSIRTALDDIGPEASKDVLVLVWAVRQLTTSVEVLADRVHDPVEQNVVYRADRQASDQRREKMFERERLMRRPHPLYPGWELVDCGCCNGIEWGGESPDECRFCGGGGMISRHVGSGALAMYPGGPFLGHEEALR